MAHLRGVFIAPSTINHRAHHRSKSNSEVPLTQSETFRSELSHYPHSGRVGSLRHAKNIPSLPKFAKEVTIGFRKPGPERKDTKGRTTDTCWSLESEKDHEKNRVQHETRSTPFAEDSTDSSSRSFFRKIPEKETKTEGTLRRNKFTYELVPESDIKPREKNRNKQELEQEHLMREDKTSKGHSKEEVKGKQRPPTKDRKYNPHRTPLQREKEHEKTTQDKYRRSLFAESLPSLAKTFREKPEKPKPNKDFPYQVQKIKNLQELLDSAKASNKDMSQSVDVSRDLWECNEMIKTLKDGLLHEKKITENKEKTIQNLSQEIEILDQEVNERKRENKDLSESLNTAKGKIMYFETENRILENQVRMMEDSNKNLYKELHEIRNKLRIEEGQVDELKIQKSESSRRLSQVLQSSLDRNTRFAFFLQQLESELLSRETTKRKLKAERQVLENVLGEEKIRERKLSFPYTEKVTTKQPIGLTKQEKDNLHSELENFFVDLHPSSNQLSVEKILQMTEKGITEGLRTRLGAKDDETFELQKTLDLAKTHVKALRNTEEKCFDDRKGTEEKIRLKRRAIGEELKDIARELSSAQLTKKEHQSNLAGVRKFSNAEPRIRNLNVMSRTSREEIADIHHAIRSMESKSHVTNDNLSVQEKMILSLNQKMSKTMEAKVDLAEQLLEVRSTLESFENRYEAKQVETEKLDKELSLKREEISEMEQSLQEALSEMTEMMIKLDSTNVELEEKEKKIRELEKGKERTEESGDDSRVGEEVKADEDNRTTLTKTNQANLKLISKSEKGTQVDDMKDELVETLLCLESAQVERQEALRINEELSEQLEKREQEISTLIIELESFRENRSQPPPPKRLSELWSTIHEEKQGKRESKQRFKGLEQELIVKQRELSNVKSALTKQQKHTGDQLDLLDNYKKELADVKQELLEKKQKYVQTQNGDSEFERQEETAEVEEEESGRTSELNSGLSEVEKERDGVEDTVDDLWKEADIREYSIVTLQSDVEDLQRFLATEMEASEHYQKQVSNLKESLQNAKEAKDCAFERNKELEEELQRKCDKVQNLTSALEESYKDVEPAGSEASLIVPELRATSERIEKEEQRLEMRVQDLENELEKTECGLTELQFEGSDPFNDLPNEEFVTSTPRTKNEKQRDRDQVKDNDTKEENGPILIEMAGLKQELEILRTRVRIRDKKLEEKNNEIYEKETVIKKLQSEKEVELQELAETITRLEEESEMLRNENTILEDEASDTIDVSCLRDENRVLRKQVKNLSYELAVKHAEVSDLRQELQTAESKCIRLEECLAKLQCIKEELECTADDLSFQKSSQEKEIDLLRKKVQIVEEEMKLTATDNQVLDAVDSRPLAEENETLKTQISEISLELVLNREQVQKLQVELGVSERMCSALETSLTELEKKKYELESLADDLSFQKNTQKKELELLKKKMAYTEEEIRLTEEDLTKKAEEMKEKEKELHKLLDESSATERERRTLANTLKSAVENNDIYMKAKEGVIVQLTKANSNLQAEIDKIKMDSSESRYEQRRLERELTEMRDRFRDADRKFGATKEEKKRIEEELKATKTRMGQYQTELNDARANIRDKEETIRKLNYKNTELQTLLSERDDSLRREERLRMENMKSLDVMKIKLNKMEGEEKKQKDRLFSLKSACSEANEAYEIVKKQNLALRHDMAELKKKLADRDSEVESNKREKECLEEQILNASRTIDDIRKYSSRDDTMSPDSALGISIDSLTDIASGPNSPKSDVSDNLFVAGDEYLKFGGPDQSGLLCKMPSMIENFRAVVRDNEAMKGKLIELITTKQKLDGQLQHYSGISNDLKKDVEEKEHFIEELREKIRMLEHELHQSKTRLVDVEKNFAATATETNLVKTTLEVCEETVAELREKVELLEEQENTLQLYSKSMSEKFEYEASQKKQFEQLNESLQDDNQQQKQLLETLEKRLSAFTSKENQHIPFHKPEESDVAIVTLEGKLDMIVKHSEAVASSLSTVREECSNLQLENVRLQDEMVKREVYKDLEARLEQQEKMFQDHESLVEEKISDLERQRESLENENKEKEQSIVCWVKREEDLLDDMRVLKQKFSPLETANDIYKAEIKALNGNFRQADETRNKMETEIKSAKAKMCEMEITNEAYKDDNDRLRSEIIALSKEKCDVECKISEAERQEKKLNEIIEHECAQRNELKAEHETVLNNCETLHRDLSKAKENISRLETEQEKIHKVKNEMERKLLELSTDNGTLNDDLRQARKDLVECEERFRKSIQEEESLSQKLSMVSLERSKLSTAHEQSQKRKDAAEKSLVEANAQNEDFEAALKNARVEKAGVLMEIAQKGETIQRMEAKKSELEDEKRKFTNELYLSTKKVLSLQLNLESLRNEVSQLGKELRRLVQESLGREPRDEAEERSMEADIEMSLIENEVVIQALRQSIKTTKKSLDLIRPEAKVTEHEHKNCQRDIDCAHREFAFLKDHLTNFKHSCQKLSDEIRRLKEDVKTKEILQQDTREEYESTKQENLENKESIIELQGKCTDLETLFAEYENKAENTHDELVHANQHIATLETNIAKLEQKRTTLEKERLVYQEKMKNLEANSRAAKDETRNDKKRIATLEVEYTEKRGLAREMEKMENTLTELRLKNEDLLKEREETKADLATAREEQRQEQLELKNSRKEGENLKNQISLEKPTRRKIEQDLTENVELLKTHKSKLHDVQRHFAKLQEENSVLEEKSKLLDEAGQTLKKETDVQSVEIRRLRDSLTDVKNQLVSVTTHYEGSEKERKQLVEDLLHAEEQVKKLQDTCNELLREKGAASDKVASLNDALEVIISSHEETVNNLKQEQMTTNKDLAITRSSLERSQKREEELQNMINSMGYKVKTMEEKKKEIVGKFWTSQNELSEAESGIDSLKAEKRDLKIKSAASAQRVEKLEEIIQQEREENEQVINTCNEKIITFKSQLQRTSEERDDYLSKLEETDNSLSRTSEELQQTASTLTEKEKRFACEIDQRNGTIDELRNAYEGLRGELNRTKESFKEARIENCDLKERLSATEEKLDSFESKLHEQENDNVDALAEAQAKLNVVNKMRASNCGERFAELQSSPLVLEDEFGYLDKVDAAPSMNGPIKDTIAAFHQACMSSFNDNRILQENLAQAKQEVSILEETSNKNKNEIAELKRYLMESEKKKTKLAEEVKRLRRRLESLKQKSIEMEKEKDDELCEVQRDKTVLEKDHWELREDVEELKANLNGVEEERDRYAKDLDTTRKQLIEARNEIKSAQQQFDAMQDKLLEMKKRTFELDTNDKTVQQLLQEKEKELHASQAKSEELEKLYDACNQKKTELYTQASKAEDKIRDLEQARKENETEQAALKKEINTLQNKVIEQEHKLKRTQGELEETNEINEELEIQRGSLQASNEILKHQVEVIKGENRALKDSFDKVQDGNVNLTTTLNQTTAEKENLETGFKCLSQEKDRVQELLKTTAEELRDAEENLVKAFQENEALKRQMLKVQSSSCADSIKLQTEIGKQKSELDSTKKELVEKVKGYNDQFTKCKVVEKENEFLKKELGETHSREAELKLDFTSTNSKLQSYILERECWEREVKTVLGEFEHQKSSNVTKEQRLERLRVRYEQEIGFLSQRVSALERELRVVQEAGEQQRHADEIACKLAVEAKDIEIDSLKMRLQATRMHASDRNSVVDEMKGQLDERSKQITDLMEQMRILKDSYHLELASLQADLKCSQMENLLKLKRDMDHDSQFIASQDTVSDLLAAIKGSRKESERLRKLLGNKMKEMKTLKRHILVERTSPWLSPGTKSYAVYSRDKDGDISID